MKKIYRFDNFKRPTKTINESMTPNLPTGEAKEAIEKIFRDHDGELPKQQILNIWEEDPYLREELGERIFAKAWSELIDAEEIKTEDGTTFCWCDMVGESVNESISKEDEEKYLSAKQRKLPEGLKKSIISRAKKSKKKTDNKDKE